MRASTGSALVVSSFLGLAVATGVRAFGFFQAAPRLDPPQVLVAASNLYSGMLMTSDFVRVRPLRPDEAEQYRKAPREFLPAVPESVSQRVTAKPVEADQPIRRTDLEPMERPDLLRERLAPNMRTVNLSLTKEQSSGGLLQAGDWVDVFLKTVVGTADGDEATRTACLARKVRVVVKRNSIVPIFAPFPEDRPIKFEVETNAYRASLIELAKEKGLISLKLLPTSENDVLEARRVDALKHPTRAPVASYAEPGGAEQIAETVLVERFLDGAASVGDEDLARIFAMKPAKPKAQPVRIRQYVRGQRLDDIVIDSGSTEPALAFRFRAPDPPAADPKKETARKPASGTKLSRLSPGLDGPSSANPKSPGQTR